MATDTATERPAAARTGPPRNRPAAAFAVLAAGYGTSAYGNFLNLVAVNLYAFETSGSGLQTGALMAARLGAGFVAGPVAGRAAARLDRRAVLIGADLAQALVMLCLAVLAAAWHTHLLWVAAVVLGVGHTFSTVALRTSVPHLAGDVGTVRGNGYLTTARSLAMLLGFASAGPLISVFGYRTAFAVNAASFVVSLVVLLCVPLSFRAGTTGIAPGATRPADPRRPLAALAIGGPAVLVTMVALRGVEGWGSASHNVALPILAATTAPASPAVLLSQFWTAWAAGGLVMYRLVAWWLRRTGHRLGERTYAGAVCLASLAFIASFTDVPAGVLMAVAALAGFADGLADLAYATRLQASPDDVRARLFGTSATVEALGLAAGMACGAVLLERFAPLPVVALFHGLVVVAALLLLLYRSGRRSPADPRR